MIWANHRAILGAVILQVATGVALMSPPLLLNPWAIAFRLDPAAVRPDAAALVLGVCTALAYDYLFAWLIHGMGISRLGQSLLLTLALWGGVILVADFGHLLFAQVGATGIAINAFLRLINGLWAGWILFRWRPQPA